MPHGFLYRVLYESESSAGWDCWIKGSRGGGPSVAEKFTEASGGRLVLQKENRDRVSGANQVRDYVALNPKTNKPKLFIFKTCPLTFDTLTRMTHDSKNPEDVLKVDAIDGDPWTGDEMYDCLRMALMNRPRVAVRPVEDTPKRRDYFERFDKAANDGGWTTV